MPSTRAHFSFAALTTNAPVTAAVGQEKNNNENIDTTYSRHTLACTPWQPEGTDNC
jgi:hypothetical protein